MIIISQDHEILSMDDLRRVEMAGRTCYKSEDKIGCTDPDEEMICDMDWADEFTEEDAPCSNSACSLHSSHKFVRMLIRRGHHAMLEHGSASVKFVTNRGVTHEVVRHRIASFGQESTRYVKYDGDTEFIKPVWLDGPWIPTTATQYNGATGRIVDAQGTNKALTKIDVYMAAFLFAEAAYKTLLELGEQPQHAREVLPNALKTEIVVTANFREWRHIFALRAIGTTGPPHPQMQALMAPVLKSFADRLPAMYEDLLQEYTSKYGEIK